MSRADVQTEAEILVDGWFAVYDELRKRRLSLDNEALATIAAILVAGRKPSERE